MSRLSLLFLLCINHKSIPGSILKFMEQFIRFASYRNLIYFRNPVAESSGTGNDQFVGIHCLCYPVTSVKNNFLTACLFCLLVGNNTGNQVQGLNITMKKSGVFQCNGMEFLLLRRQIHWHQKCHQVRFHLCLIWEEMIP